MIVWITGLSGSGKTTLGRALAEHLRNAACNVVLLDGDEIRELFGNDLGYRENDRVCQIQRMQRLAKLLERQGTLVIVAALYANDELLHTNRELFSDYVEIYLKASVDFLATREFKGLYRRARSGEMSDVVGVDILWHEPTDPHLVFDMASGIGTASMMNAVLERLQLPTARNT